MTVASRTQSKNVKPLPPPLLLMHDIERACRTQCVTHPLLWFGISFSLSMHNQLLASKQLVGGSACTVHFLCQLWTAGAGCDSSHLQNRHEAVAHCLPATDLQSVYRGGSTACHVESHCITALHLGRLSFLPPLSQLWEDMIAGSMCRKEAQRI